MYEVSAELLQSVIATLKGIDVRGYESMDRLVGLVMLFERILNSPPIDKNKEDGEE
jgi:hypothetical protein